MQWVFIVQSKYQKTAIHRKKEVNLKSRNDECASSIVPAFFVYGFISLSASFFSCSACSFNNLARSSASACFWLRYSKSITESVRLRIKSLSRCHLHQQIAVFHIVVLQLLHTYRQMGIQEQGSGTENQRRQKKKHSRTNPRSDLAANPLIGWQGHCFLFVRLARLQRVN